MNPPPQAGGFFLRKTGLASKDFLGVKTLSRTEILSLLDKASEFKSRLARGEKKFDDLKGKTVINLFFEPSTRTRVSFEMAARRLSADLMTIAPQTTSLSKGESLHDMIENLEALQPDLMIVRHNASGAPELISRYTKAGVINAGDGSHEHPTQALLDAFTVREALGGGDVFKNLKLLIVGDIAYSRVARSNIHLFQTLGAQVTCVAPATLLPPGLETFGAKGSSDLDAEIGRADVVMLLRIQKERQEKLNFPSLAEYTRFFGLSRERRERMKPEALILHPGPINRGVEIDTDIADGKIAGGPRTLILDQVANGLAVRMAVLSTYGAAH